MNVCLSDHVIISSFCLWCVLIADCLGSQCTSSLSYPPSEQLSLCTSRRLTLTKLAILPDNDCTCQLTISVHDRVRIAAKIDSSQTPDCAREAFVISNLATSVNTRPLCEMGACEELGSPTERSVYVLSYRSELASTETSLRLWLEAVADPETESVRAQSSLECGYRTTRDLDVARLFFRTTTYWTSAAAVRTYPTYTTPTTTTTTTTATSTTSTTTSSTSTTTTSTTTSTTSQTTTSTPTPDTPSLTRSATNATSTGNVFSYVTYWRAIFESKNLIIVISVALALTVVIIVVVAAVMFYLERKKAKNSPSTEPDEHFLDIFINGEADNHANETYATRMYEESVASN